MFQPVKGSQIHDFKHGITSETGSSPSRIQTHRLCNLQWKDPKEPQQDATTGDLGRSTLYIVSNTYCNRPRCFWGLTKRSLIQIGVSLKWHMGNVLKMIQLFKIGTLWLFSLAAVPHNWWSFAGGNDHLVKVWDYNEGEVTHVGVGHSGNITRVRISPGNEYIVSVSADGAILRWKYPFPSWSSSDLLALQHRMWPCWRLSLKNSKTRLGFSRLCFCPLVKMFYLWVSPSLYSMHFTFLNGTLKLKCVQE